MDISSLSMNANHPNKGQSDLQRRKFKKPAQAAAKKASESDLPYPDSYIDIKA